MAGQDAFLDIVLFLIVERKEDSLLTPLSRFFFGEFAVAANIIHESIENLGRINLGKIIFLVSFSGKSYIEYRFFWR